MDLLSSACMSVTDILGNFSPRSIPERFSLFFLQKESHLPDEGEGGGGGRLVGEGGNFF